MSRGFRDLHPVVTFIYYTGVLLLLLLMFHPLFILSACILLLAVNLLYDGGKELFRWKGAMGMTAGVILVVNPLTSERGTHVLWEGTSHRVTWEAVLYGGMMSGIILCVMATFISYQQVIPTNKFLYLFSRLLPQWALLIVLALRLVPLLRERLGEIEMVHRSREDEIPKLSLQERLRRSMKRLEVLLTWSLEEGLQRADSMKARGYGTGRRSSYSPYRWRPQDGGALLFLLISGGACFYGWTQGLGVLTIYPEMGSLGLTDEGWALLGGYLSFLGFPVLVELGGMIHE
ncbi:ABC transporter permease [Kroppenstedtia guangzhouensis]|uniref:ABC transporter permease n=1 Tax=Kroppenstedtia guangzhouensis TaxID=1274356 RepID=A0ABQ1FZE7_9BACL|nr:energy-coupling factor transporter transmembrane component T [Kroppenstedtia guangzhouensis]GGA33809.1 ABC transporter permease [Kroppenstedtia guangzhouensis]